MPERGQSPFDAIDEVYRLPIETTCQMVAEVLRHYPLIVGQRQFYEIDWSKGWKVALGPKSAPPSRNHSSCSILRTRTSCAARKPRACWMPGRAPGNLFVGRCDSRSASAPAVAEAKQRHAQRRRDQEVHDILIKRLPPRELKVMGRASDPTGSPD